MPTLENGGVRLRADGGMDVTWKLRPGVTWHDGTPFTSADVQVHRRRDQRPELQPREHRRLRSHRVGGHAGSADGDRALQGDLRAVRHPVHPRHAAEALLEGRDIDRAQDYNRNPLGTGPYRVAEWKAGEYILLERVPHYWRGDEYPKIRRLLFKFIANTNTRINQLKSGEVHVVALVPWDKYREIADLDVDRRARRRRATRTST